MADKRDKPSEKPSDTPVWDYDRRVKEGDLGDASFVTSKHLRANLAEVLNRVGFGGEQIVVKRHGKPFVAIVATYDLQACQALEDYNDGVAIQKAIDAGELDEPGITFDEFEAKYGSSE
jgi:prevent-host-death family protein